MIPATEIVHLDSIRENKLSLVERLADDLAHEIKNPLHSMVINLEVLRRRLARLEDSGNEEMLRYAGVLGKELERVNRRIDLLLRFVRANPASEDVALLAETVDELSELIELECERHKVTLVIDQDPGLLGARAPRAETRQMILTLALKVLDQLPRGGSLNIAMEADADASRILVQGRDAAGSPAGVDPTTDEALLSVVRRLAEQIGARLDYRAGSGTNGATSNTSAHVLTFPHRR